jgi:hypothetical protein
MVRAASTYHVDFSQLLADDEKEKGKSAARTRGSGLQPEDVEDDLLDETLATRREQARPSNVRHASALVGDGPGAASGGLLHIIRTPPRTVIYVGGSPRSVQRTLGAGGSGGGGGGVGGDSSALTAAAIGPGVGDVAVASTKPSGMRHAHAQASARWATSLRDADADAEERAVLSFVSPSMMPAYGAIAAATKVLAPAAASASAIASAGVNAAGERTDPDARKDAQPLASIADSVSLVSSGGGGGGCEAIDVRSAGGRLQAPAAAGLFGPDAHGDAAATAQPPLQLQRSTSSSGAWELVPSAPSADFAVV